MEANTLKADIKIEESEREREIWTNLELQLIQDIVKLQRTYGVQYEDHNFMPLQTPALVPENKSALGKAYKSKRPIGHILMICQEI